MRHVICAGIMAIVVAFLCPMVAQAERTAEEQRAYLEKLWSRFTEAEKKALAEQLGQRIEAIKVEAQELERERQQITARIEPVGAKVENKPAAKKRKAVAQNIELSNFKLLRRLDETQSSLDQLRRSQRSLQGPLLTVSFFTNASIEERASILDENLLRLQAESISQLANLSYLMCGDDILDKSRRQYWQPDLERFSKSHLVVGESVGRVQCSQRNDEVLATCTATDADQAKWGFRNVGTGFVVRADAMVTNRHVVEAFAVPGHGSRWNLRSGFSARVDFPGLYEGCSGTRSPVVRTVSEVYVHPEEDVALLRFHEPGLPAPLKMQSSATLNEQVAVIGYPERDAKVSREVQELVFRGPKGDAPFGVRRIQPGEVTRVVKDKRDWWRTDASTLNGNSGSPVVRLADGTVVGIHIGGYPGGENVFIGTAHIRRLIEETLAQAAK